MTKPANAKRLGRHTRRAYASAWRLFNAWCQEEGFQALPADDETVAAYLTDRANQGRAMSTIKLARTAIRYSHETHGFETPTSSPGVRRLLRDLERREGDTASGSGRGQTIGLTADDFAKIRAKARLPRTWRRESEETARRRGAIDIALISTMRDALLRRSEAVALTWSDIEFRPGGTAYLTIRRSKTDQEGEDAVQFLGPEASAALRDIRPDADDIGTQRVFGLSLGRTIANRIKEAAKAADLKGDFSGHSPRLGMAMDLDEAGISRFEIARAGRWTSLQTLECHLGKRVASGGRCDVVALYYASRR